MIYPKPYSIYLRGSFLGMYGVGGLVFGAFPRFGVPFLGVPKIRMIVFLSLCWGPPYYLETTK